MLESLYTSDDDEMNTGASKSTHLKPAIKKFMKETRLGLRPSRNF